MPISIISNIKITLFFTVSFFLIQINSQLSQDSLGTCIRDGKANQYRSQTEIEKAITQLISNASNTYFSNTSTGSGINQFNALYNCRRDFSLTTCKSCVESAFDISRFCLPNKEGSTYFEECMVHYSNDSSPSIESSRVSRHSGRILTIKEEPNFRQILNNIISNLINNVSSDFNTSSSYFATTAEKYSSTETLYAIAQCIPYIASSNCSSCLRNNFDWFMITTSNDRRVTYAQIHSSICQLNYLLSDEELSRPWNFRSYLERHPDPSSSATGTQGSSIFGAMMASISSVALCLFLL